MFETWLAHDGNGSADFDQKGRPIVPGKYYITWKPSEEDDELMLIFAGPFQDYVEAETAMADLKKITR